MRLAFVETLCRLSAEDEPIWLLCADLGYSVLERSRVAEKMSPPATVCLEGHGAGDAGRPRYVSELIKLNMLGFAQLYDLDTSLERTIQHLPEEQGQGISR